MAKRVRKEKVPYENNNVYTKPPIPYAVSQPNKFWRIKKGQPADVYWKKRYWRRRITGRGDYRMDPEQSFGRRWGGYLGSKLGEWAGGAAHSAFRSITGLGDYKVRRNVFMSGRLPEIANIAGNGGTVIRFQEYLGDVVTSETPGAFRIDDYLINAANEKTFPFLSQVAANYDQYEMQGLIFEFRSTSGDALNSTNTALGSVMMATQYDTVDTPFSSKGEMLNYEFSVSSQPSKNQLHMIECDPHQTPISLLFTEPSLTNPPNTDPRMYFLGRFQIATTGFQGAAVNIGELHITYQVKLLKPKLVTALGSDISMFVGNTNSYTNATPIPNGAAVSNTGGFVIGNNSTIYFPMSPLDKCYSVWLFWAGTSAAITHPSYIFVGKPGTFGAGRFNSVTSPQTGATTQSVQAQLYVKVPANNGPTTTNTGLQLNSAVLPSSGTQMRFVVLEIPANAIV